MKTLLALIIIATQLLVIVVGLIIYTQFIQVELNDSALHSPVENTLLQIDKEWLIAEEFLPSGFTYDNDRKSFYISTDKSTQWFSSATVNIVEYDANFIYKNTLSIEAKGDMEGIVYVGNKTLIGITEKGTIYVFRTEPFLSLQEKKPRVIASKKIGGIAFDGQFLYAAEKEGKKTIYKIALNVHSMEMELQDSFVIENYPDNFTISGMDYYNGLWYILSEAYSSVFVYDMQDREFVDTYGIQGIHESSGITILDGVMYIVRDFESYLPQIRFYAVLFE